MQIYSKWYGPIPPPDGVQVYFDVLYVIIPREVTVFDANYVFRLTCSSCVFCYL